jgi:hypothetical protein
VATSPAVPGSTEHTGTCELELAQWDMSKSNSEESEILARINGRYPPGADDSNLTRVKHLRLGRDRPCDLFARERDLATL